MVFKTMAEEKKQTYIITPEFRVSYANIWVPKTNDKGKAVYSCTAIFPKDTDLQPLKALLMQAKEAKFPNMKGKCKNPLRFGNEEEYDLDKNPEYRDCWITSFRSYGRPVGVVDTQRQPIIDQQDFYSGCHAVASITAYAYDFEGTKGVAFGLRNLMKTRDDEPLAGTAKAEVDFAEMDTSKFTANNSELFEMGDI